MKAESSTTEVRWTMLEMEEYHIACHSHDIAEALQNKRMELQPILYYIYTCVIALIFISAFEGLVLSP